MSAAYRSAQEVPLSRRAMSVVYRSAQDVALSRWAMIVVYRCAQDVALLRRLMIVVYRSAQDVSLLRRLMIVAYHPSRHTPLLRRLIDVGYHAASRLRATDGWHHGCTMSGVTGAEVAEREPAAERDAQLPGGKAPHRVLILGGGFAGVQTAQALEKRLGDRTDVEIWLVNQDNFMLFTPLLPEVCSGHLEPRHVVSPLRSMVKRPSTWCITAEVRKMSLADRTVTVLGGDGDLHRLRWDTLVLALGGETATFGIKGIEEHAVGMKTLADAFSLRNRLIEMLERAELEEDPAEREAQLTFVVGGGGFSGVETAGEMEDFIHHVRKRYYPNIGDDEIKAYLVELNDALLPEMPSQMGRYARRKLEQRGYQVLLGTPIKEVHEATVVLGDGRTIPARTVVWTGGVRPAPLVAESGVECDHAGRARVKPTMETSEPGVFAIGDCASIPRAGGKASAYAPTAQNAVREGKQLADNVLARIDGRELQPFRYETIGTLASIGAHTGVGVVFGVKVRGWIAWFMWRGYYWSRVPGFNRKVRVGIDWLLTALFGADPVQLKVENARSALGSSGRRRPPVQVDGSRQ